MPKPTTPREAAFYQITVAPSDAPADGRERRLILTFVDKAAAADFGFRAVAAGHKVSETVGKLYRDADDAENDLRFWFA